MIGAPSPLPLPDRESAPSPRWHCAGAGRERLSGGHLIAEERENLMGFGENNAAYMKRTRRFIPFSF
jgi:hypothetical protein